MNSNYTDNFDKIKITPKGQHHAITLDNNSILLNTDVLYCPFGLERVYNDYYLKLCFRGMKNNKELNDLCFFIYKLEKKIIEMLNISEDTFKSQFRFSEKYEPLLTVKIPVVKDQFSCECVETVEDRAGVPFNIYKIEPKTKMKLTLLIDRIWFFKGNYSYKIKAKKIEICV